MAADLDLPLILSAALLATASPGPATLTIADLSMRQGRRLGLAAALGVTTGSLTWSIAASLGLGALMLANVWAAEMLRDFGAGYLLYLALRSARQALWPTAARSEQVETLSPGQAYRRGLALHLTNPKAILFFGSLYALGVSPGTPWSSLAVVIAAVGLQSALVFHGYALLFSSARIAGVYARLRRWFEVAFALAFGAASLKVLTARLQ